MVSKNEPVMNPAREIVNALKLVGDVMVLPGASLLMQGKVPQGGAHAILGMLAWRTLPPIAGPLGWVALAANAYTKSTSGHYLHDYLLGAFRGRSQPSDAPADNPVVGEASQSRVDAVPSDPDDLTRLEGIGPKIAGVLRERGIGTFNQLANTGVDRLREILREANLGMIDPTTWPEQATRAAAGEWDALEALQNGLTGGRRE